MARFNDRYGYPRYFRRPQDQRDAEILIPRRRPARARNGHVVTRAAPLEPTQLRELETKVERLEGEAAEWKEKYARLAAERDNVRKRLQRAYAGQAEQETEQVLRDMLPLADNLHRALAHASQDDAALREGVSLTLKAFEESLARYGVAPIEAEGEAFDPAWHEAISAVPHPTLPAGTIISVEETGYRLGEKLLRPAKVLVAAENDPADHRKDWGNWPVKETIHGI